MLVGLLMGASVAGAVCVIIDRKDELSGGVQFVLIVVFVLVCPYYLWSNYIDFDKLKERRCGPFTILRHHSPQLYSYYEELEQLSIKELDLIERLSSEKSVATSGSAQKMYERQIKEAKKRLDAMEAMSWRINNIATEIYFSSYLDKLEQRKTSEDFQAELQQIKKDCDALMRLHANLP